MRKIRLRKIIRNFFLNSILLFFSIVFFLFIFEIVLRVGFPENDTDKLCCYDSLYGWTPCKNAKGRFISHGDYNHLTKINSKGWRDSENLDINKKNIIILGDSFTFNEGISNPDEVFTEILEKRYFKDYNVINLGVNGYGTTQEYLRLKEEGLAYNPEIVLLVFYIGNDFYDNTGINVWVNGYERPLFKIENNSLRLTNVPVPKKDSSMIKEILVKLRVANFFDSRIKNIDLFRKALEMIGLKDRITEEQIEYESLPPIIKLINLNDPIISYSYNLTCMILSKLNLELKEKGIKFYLVIASTMPQIRNDYFYKLQSEFNISEKERFLPNNELIKCSNLNGIEFIDLSQEFLLLENLHEVPYLYYPKEAHWNRKGNQVVAEVIYRNLEKRAK